MGTAVSDEAQAQEVIGVLTAHLREHLGISLRVEDFTPELVVKPGVVERTTLVMTNAEELRARIGERIITNFMSAFFQGLPFRIGQGTFEPGADPADHLKAFFVYPVVRLIATGGIETSRIYFKKEGSFFDYRSTDHNGVFARFSWIDDELVAGLLDHDPFTPIPGA